MRGCKHGVLNLEWQNFVFGKKVSEAHSNIFTLLFLHFIHPLLLNKMLDFISLLLTLMYRNVDYTCYSSAQHAHTHDTQVNATFSPMYACLQSQYYMQHPIVPGIIMTEQNARACSCTCRLCIPIMPFQAHQL